MCLRPTKVALIVGTAGVLLWGAIAVTGTIDQFRYHRTVVEARAWLLRQGVSAEHIDAGYALTGWWLYAHAPSGPPSCGSEPDVPWITGWRPLPYKIANAATPAYAMVRSFRRPMLWAASDTIYVLEHSALTDHWGLPPCGHGSHGARSRAAMVMPRRIPGFLTAQMPRPIYKLSTAGVTRTVVGSPRGTHAERP
jgi:hypothetical protein